MQIYHSFVNSFFVHLAIVANSATSVALALAIASIGAIFSSTSPDMGIQGVLERFKQISPTLLFTETEVSYAGKKVVLEEKIREIAKQLHEGGLKGVVLLPSILTGKDVKFEGISNTYVLLKIISLHSY